MTTEELPSYADLAARTDGKPPGTAWGVFGANDEVGTINLLTAERVLAGVREVQLGQVHSLNWDVTQPSPHPYRPVAERTHIAAQGLARDDFLSPMYLQYSSQWDGLRHIEVGGSFYNGVAPAAVDDPSSTTLGIQHWAERGIAGRGVLLDVARYEESKGRPIDQSTPFEITASLLDEVAAAQQVTVEPGDVLLIRTGWVGWYQGLDLAGRTAALTTSSAQPGLAPVEETAAWIWDHHVAAVAADNMALEVAPLNMVDDHFLHLRLIPGFGLAIGEFFWLDGLAAACASDNRWSFLFTSAPLNVPGGVGSPPNALAIR
ncbi:MAG: putative cyclase SCIF3 [Acidimicrobiia bacterium]|nr:putative cyclase SCIF3 [Acidimicrobiia bacterium]